MDAAINILIIGGLTFVALLLVVFTIYWFELDDKFLKGFEPLFRKLTDKRQT